MGRAPWAPCLCQLDGRKARSMWVDPGENSPCLSRQSCLCGLFHSFGHMILFFFLALDTWFFNTYQSPMLIGLSGWLVVQEGCLTICLLGVLMLDCSIFQRVFCFWLSKHLLSISVAWPVVLQNVGSQEQRSLRNYIWYYSGFDLFSCDS